MSVALPIFQPVYESPTQPVVNGASFGLVNESVMTFRPFSGGETGGTFEGPDAVIQAKAVQLCNNGYSVNYKRSKSPISILTFSAAFNAGGNGGAPINPNNDYTDTWEVIRNTTQKELLESDHPLVSLLDATNFSELKAVINNPGLVYRTVGTGAIDFGAIFTNTTPASYNAAVYLFNLFASGVKTIPVKQPILQLTRTTNPFYTAPFSVANVDTILSTPTMLADSGVPNDFAIPLLDLAATLEARAGNMIAREAAAGINLAFGWYKDLVGSNKHGQKRIVFTLRYEFGLFDQALYGSPS